MLAVLFLLFALLAGAPPVFTNVSLPLHFYFRPCSFNTYKSNVLASQIFNEINKWGMFQLHLDRAGNNSICFSSIYNTVPGRTIVSESGLYNVQIATQLPPHLLIAVVRHELGHCLGLDDSPDKNEASIMALVVGEPSHGVYKEIPTALWYSIHDIEAIRHNFFAQDWSNDLVVPCV